MAQYELNLRDYWQIVRKQRRTIALTAVLVAVASLGLSQLLKPTPQYEATASVKYDRSSNFTGLFLEVMTYSYSDDIGSQTEVIKSFPVVESAARKAGLFDPALTSEQIKLRPDLLGMILSLQRRTNTEREGNTNIIRITATADEPDKAALLANSIVSAYQEENSAQRNRQVAEARKFIEQQMQIVEGQLRTAEQSVENFKESNDVVDLGEEVKIQLTEMARVESEHAKTIRTMEEIEDQIGQLGRQGSLSMASASATGSAVSIDPARIFTEEAAAQVFMLNSRLMDLLQERDTLLISYHPTHPQVVEFDQKIQVIREEMLRELTAKRTTFQRRGEQLGERLAAFKRQYASVPEKALQLARMEREVKINNDIYLLLKTKYQEALIKGAESIVEVTPIQPAFKSALPINVPNTLLNVLVGALIGCLLGLLIGFVQESFDTSLGTIEDVESFLGLPVLGVLPQAGPDVMKHATPEMLKHHASSQSMLERVTRALGFRPLWAKRAGSDHGPRGWSPADLALLYAPKSALAESYRSLRTNLLFSALDRPLQVLQLTSVGIGEGKTSVAVNLAISMAQAGKRVLIIDADLRRPAIHQVFGIEKSPGLTELLMGTKSFEQVCRSLPDLMMGRFKVDEIMASPGIDKLNIITSGFMPPNPSECLNSARLQALVTSLKRDYDLIIFDAPPTLPVSDSIIIGRLTDGTLLVYQVGDIPRVALRRAKMLLEQAHTKLTGIVLNNIRAEISMDPYQFQYHYPYFASPESKGEASKLTGAGRG